MCLAAAFFAGPSSAAAQVFEVDSTSDAPNTGGGCETELGKCTLRAAIEAANQRPGLDTVNFDTTVFTGSPTETIEPATELPPITDPLSIIDGCPTREPGFPSGTCVGLDASGLAAGFQVGSDEVTIEGFAITGATVGILVTNSADEFAARRDHLGADLSGAAGPNGIGVRLGPGSNNDQIGTYTSHGAPGWDLFVNNTEVGLDLEGASHTRVQASQFGVLGDRAPNGTNIEISDVSTGGRIVRAEDNEIGAERTFFTAHSMACYDRCNVIAGALGDGIDLGGDGGVELPASGPTRILGNVFGATGSDLYEVAVPNNNTAVAVGSAGEVTIGGPTSSTEGNFFNGGKWAVTAGPNEQNLEIEGNTVGLTTSEYPQVLEPPTEGAFSVDTLNSPNSQQLPWIAGNRISMQGGVGILDAGGGAMIVENGIYHTDTGIRVEGERFWWGTSVEGNELVAPGEFGIDIRNWQNRVTGNLVLGATRAGVRVESKGWTGGTEDYIGGNEAEEENEIDFSGDAAIEVLGNDTAFVDVLRNFGSGNGGPFIDLGGDGLGNPMNGPNEGIQAPTILAAKPTEVRGDGALGGGTAIRVFLKASSAPGEIEEFLASTTAAEDGSWSVALPEPLPVGVSIGVTQTAYRGTSEMAVSTVTAEPVTSPSNQGGGQSNSAFSPSPLSSPSKHATPTAPNARILSGPKGVIGPSAGKRVSFKFTSDLDGLLECSLDGVPFRPCLSPRTYTHLKLGRHRFRVRAVGPNGALDATPAERTFRVVRQRGSDHRPVQS